MLMGKWIISFYRSFKLIGQTSRTTDTAVASEWVAKKKKMKQTLTNEWNEMKIKSQARAWRKKNAHIHTWIRAEIDKRPKITNGMRKRDENVGDGKLKTNKENALTFIQYSVDVCWFFSLLSRKGPYLARRSSHSEMCVFKPQRSWDGKWITALNSPRFQVNDSIYTANIYISI